LPIKWTLETALSLIREVDPTLRERYSCFLGLCGGVLIKGASDKDLDLILIPLNGNQKAEFEAALIWLSKKWGKYTSVGQSVTEQQAFVPLHFIQYKEMSIDVILIKEFL
jgi:hypothetical protein